ncbi:hypothetical protein SD70_27260 [Gordoniibacillus kamchatkensis]|uniref:Uncharacterized protein n=1 Tax=Gordoniibacillus kamchatkensis TaxID=1590651 RepID=A0ABR5ABP7_9BACL|nr:hypothetical protein [Paenibacillus sp. VKM B-2647]KIL38317.1 hypothetical protein SD70_27260 [Paenibacillus sp. VKM B-2647]
MGKAAHKINDELSKRIIEMSLTMSSREISRALAADGIQITHSAINNHVKDVRKERSEQTKQIVQEQIAKTVPQDLEMLQKLRDELAKAVFDDVKTKADKDIWLKATKELRATIESRLKYSGADEDPEDSRLSVIFNMPRPKSGTHADD